MTSYDCIVLGVGGVGSAAAYHLARQGANVLGIDRFMPPHDRGSSHGQTRIIRQAYFEHPDYVPLVLRAYQLWEELEQRSGESLYQEVGLLQLGPAEGVVVRGVIESARLHRLRIEQLSAAQIAGRWPGFALPENLVGLFEQRAGLLRVEKCVAAHLQAAEGCGATIRSSDEVTAWRVEANRIVVQTTDHRYHADRLVITAGPWAAGLLADLRIHLEVRRKPQYWFESLNPAHQAQQGCPAFLFELPEGIFYGFPGLDERGVKVARHSGGQVVANPAAINRDLDSDELQQVQRFTAAHLPGVEPRLLHHAVCMYTMTADEHFIVDRHPVWPQVCFAAGLSGHGFKFTAVLGEILADLVLDRKPTQSIDFLSVKRPTLAAVVANP